jgi:ribosome-interacting GTPase 1
MVEIPALERGAAGKQAELLSIVMNADGLIMTTRNDEERDILKRELDSFGINKPTMYLRFKEGVDREGVMRFFHLIRAYTKEPGREAEMERPVVLRDGSSVLDAAKAVHKDFHQNMKYARVWGSSRFPGQRVEKTYALKDGDVVEFHI